MRWEATTLFDDQLGIVARLCRSGGGMTPWILEILRRDDYPLTFVPVPSHQDNDAKRKQWAETILRLVLDGAEPIHEMVPGRGIQRCRGCGAPIQQHTRTR